MNFAKRHRWSAILVASLMTGAFAVTLVVGEAYGDAAEAAEAAQDQPAHHAVHKVVPAAQQFPTRLLFDVPSSGNMQGVAVHDGVIYSSFDVGHGNGEIIEYSMTGQELKDSGPLPIGHAASLSFNDANGNVYVANGGGSHPTFVYEIDMNAPTPAIVRTLDFSSEGHSGLVAVDNENNTIWIHTGPSDRGPDTFTHCNANGRVISRFTLPNQGVPQGLDVYHGNLYYYTDNKITEISPSGRILRTMTLSQFGESEGLAVVNGQRPYLLVGYHRPNRYLAITGFLH